MGVTDWVVSSYHCTINTVAKLKKSGPEPSKEEIDEVSIKVQKRNNKSNDKPSENLKTAENSNKNEEQRTWAEKIPYNARKYVLWGSTALIAYFIGGFSREVKEIGSYFLTPEDHKIDKSLIENEEAIKNPENIKENEKNGWLSQIPYCARKCTLLFSTIGISYYIGGFTREIKEIGSRLLVPESLVDLKKVPEPKEVKDSGNQNENQKNWICTVPYNVRKCALLGSTVVIAYFLGGFSKEIKDFGSIILTPEDQKDQ